MRFVSACDSHCEQNSVLKSMSQIFQYASQCAIYCGLCTIAYFGFCFARLILKKIYIYITISRPKFQSRFINSKWSFLLLLYVIVVCHMMQVHRNMKHNSRGFLLRQIWILKNYVKSLSNNLSNENMNTGVSREIVIQKMFILAF